MRADSTCALSAAPKYTLLPTGHTAVQLLPPVNARFQLPSAVLTASAQRASDGRPNSFSCRF